jgi:hypothetical protein
VTGLACAAVFARALPLSLLLTAAAAAASSAALAGVAGLMPTFWLRRAPLVVLLAGE